MAGKNKPGEGQGLPLSHPRGASPGHSQWHADRTAARDAAFMLPHLKPGMALLDCGCGTGSITLGLAEAVAPGLVTGIDLDHGRIEQAKRNAAERGMTNVAFRVADIYEPPFPEASFDAAFEHMVFMHLDEPLRAAKEIHRVVVPGGVFGARDPDHDGWLLANAGPLVKEAQTFHEKVGGYQGTNLFLGKQLPSLLRHAGFENVMGSASCESYGTPEAMAYFSEEVFVRLLRDPDVVAVAQDQGWADEAAVGRWCAAIKEWGADTDSFAVLMRCEAVGWKA